MAVFAAPAMADSAKIGTPGFGEADSIYKGVDILGDGIFETGGSAFKFPHAADTNFDSIEVGNDRAWAFGIGFGPAPFIQRASATARNNLEIKKNQDSGGCACCQALDTSCPCLDCCTKYNVEQIKVGNRNALAVGIGAGGPIFYQGAGATAENNVKIVTNQQ